LPALFPYTTLFRSLFEDLATLVRQRPPTDALVQLDFKEAMARLSWRTVETLAAAVRGIEENFMLSGGDWAAVKRLAGAGIGMGYDPCDLPEASRLASPEDVSAFVALTEEIAPEAQMIYL